MNPDIKAEWVARLRSGEYKQGKGSLRTDDEFCCLGVLYEAAGLCMWTKKEVPAFLDVEGKQAIPPSYYVNDWDDPAGKNFAYPSTALLEKVGLDHEDSRKLAFRNDNGQDPQTFEQIADYIEREL